jgi:GT2 family glycosyltransferase/2-polyprenyl-3-methyl-5-hydroxy-6-metoxy-1,4-benzoquinol methylase
MDQLWLAKNVLATLKEPFRAPSDGEFLNIERCLEIVDTTIDYVGRHNSSVEYDYLSSHRRRLAESLSWIPMASHKNAACIDVGCYGYMAFWAHVHLGYSCVEGVEYRSDRPPGVNEFELTVGDKTVKVAIYNFDISEKVWKISRTYDTVLFFETLEHVCTDPVGIMANIGTLMTDKSSLVMSVPNSVSYRTLREFIGGTPPWVYWFFHPDLSHEPRHCFEYTPFILKMLLRSAGFEEEAFRTLYAYAEESWLGGELTIAKSLSIEPKLFGDVILVVAKKIFTSPPIRYPHCIYDSEGYYKTTYPLLEPIFRSRIDGFVEQQTNSQRIFNEQNESLTLLSGHLEERKAEIHNLNKIITEQNREIVNINQVMTEQNSEIDNINMVVTEQNSEIGRLNQVVAEQNLEITSLSQAIAERNQEIISVKQSLAQKNSEIASLKKDVEERNREIDTLNQGLEETRFRLTEIEESRSWRITRLYRAAGDALKGVGSIVPGQQGNYAKNQSNVSPGASVSTIEAQSKADGVDQKRNLREAFDSLYADVPIFFPPINAPQVSIIIPAYRGLSDLLRCLRSLAVSRPTEPTFEVIVVDDCPDEPVLWALPRSGGLVGISNEKNLGFLLSCNRGASSARGRILCFLNTDTVVLPGWLSNLVDTLDQSPRAGIVGGMLLNCDGSVQDAGWRILSNGWGYPIGRGKSSHDGSYTYRRSVDCVTGACFCIPHAIWLRLKGFDTDYVPAFYEEFDLAFRVKQLGLQVIYEPRSRVIHFHSSSYGPERRDQLSVAHQQLFLMRFTDLITKQPVDALDEFSIRCAGPERPVILVADDALPQVDQHAGSVTMTSYLRLLVESGWRVIFAPYTGEAEGPHSETLEALGVEMIRKPCTIADWLDANGKHIHWAWISRPEIAEPLLPLLRTKTSASIAYYTHDLHHLRLLREAQLKQDAELMLEAEKVKQQEFDIFLEVDEVLSPSPEEKEYINKALPKVNATTLPPYFFESNEFFVREGSHFAPLTDVLFVGGFPHKPNVDAAIYMVNEVMPIIWKKFPDVRLLLVGYAPPPNVQNLASSRVLVTGQVPELKPWFERSRLMLAGLRYGAGVKGKIIEALRSGLPVVTTSIGAEGIHVTPGEEMIIADHAQGLAEGVMALLSDPEECGRLSARGAELVARRYSRAAARSALESIFGIERCWCCGSIKVQQANNNDHSYEAIVCNDCFARGRSTALAQVIVQRMSSSGETSLSEYVTHHPQVKIYQLGSTGAIADSLRGFPNYCTSTYFPGVMHGTTSPGGIRCEDNVNVTFENDYFDIVISEDILGHAQDPIRSFSEISRVLREGGSFFFTIQQNHEIDAGETGAEFPHRQFSSLSPIQLVSDLSQMLAQSGCSLKQHHVVLKGSTPDVTTTVYEGVKL